MASEMTGETPKEILEMERLEQRLTVSLAYELEKWRWERFGKMFGGK